MLNTSNLIILLLTTIIIHIVPIKGLIVKHQFLYLSINQQILIKLN